MPGEDGQEWTEEELAFEAYECPRCGRSLFVDSAETFVQVLCLTPDGCGFHAIQDRGGVMELADRAIGGGA